MYAGPIRLLCLYTAAADLHLHTVCQEGRRVNSAIGSALVVLTAQSTTFTAVLVAAIGAGVVRLGSQHVGVPTLNKLRTLADVAMLCLDKTGTLTATTVSTCTL